MGKRYLFLLGNITVILQDVTQWHTVDLETRYEQMVLLVRKLHQLGRIGNDNTIDCTESHASIVKLYGTALIADVPKNIIREYKVENLFRMQIDNGNAILSTYTKVVLAVFANELDNIVCYSVAFCDVFKLGCQVCV